MLRDPSGYDAASEAFAELYVAYGGGSWGVGLVLQCGWLWLVQKGQKWLTWPFEEVFCNCQAATIVMAWSPLVD